MHADLIDALAKFYPPKSEFDQHRLGRLAQNLAINKGIGEPFHKFWVSIWVAFPQEGDALARRAGMMCWDALS